MKECTESTRDSAYSNYSAYVMQGNTQSESDCRTFQAGLENGGYSSFTDYGWVYYSATYSAINQQRVTESEFKEAKIGTVGYYSGHGGTWSGSDRYPVINYIPSDPSLSYGKSSPINVATALGITGSDWKTKCVWSMSNAIRVLVLASCSQLDSSIVKYYARLMKATSIRAIAGYHDTAPSYGDDTIATSFLNYCAAGNSVWYSWQHANTDENWAVLVYQSNDNQYYRLPGYPGKTYSDPASTASVYRYASFLANPQETPTNVNLNPEYDNYILPLSISIHGSQMRNAVTYISRETVVRDASIPDAEPYARKVLIDIIGDDEARKTICIQRHITREIVDDDEGILRDGATVIERTYRFVNTYNSVKIVDNYISVSVDANGISEVTNRWLQIADVEESKERLGNINGGIISEEEAISIAKSATECEQFEVYHVNYAYVPKEEGEYVLCREVVSSCGFCYVNIQTGDVIHVL